MPDRTHVIALHRAHPEWTSRQIARELLGNDAPEWEVQAKMPWIRATAQRNGFVLGSAPRRKELSLEG